MRKDHVRNVEMTLKNPLFKIFGMWTWKERLDLLTNYFVQKNVKWLFFIKRAKARRLEIRPITLVIPDKVRAILTDQQIRESKIYNLREIQLLLRGSGLEQWDICHQ